MTNEYNKRINFGWMMSIASIVFLLAMFIMAALDESYEQNQKTKNPESPSAEAKSTKIDPKIVNTISSLKRFVNGETKEIDLTCSWMVGYACMDKNADEKCEQSRGENLLISIKRKEMHYSYGMVHPGGPPYFEESRCNGTDCHFPDVYDFRVSNGRWISDSFYASMGLGFKENLSEGVSLWWFDHNTARLSIIRINILGLLERSLVKVVSVYQCLET